jgi:2-(1,2-epoxy-1,2-dihydrophenyl)acetyl-CoA isomerase
MKLEHILLSVDGGIARLRLNRPASLNALSRPLLGEMIAVLDHLSTMPAVRVLLMSGEGRGFSSGADFSDGSSLAGTPGFDAGAALEQYYNPLMERLFMLPIPVIAALRGPVAGAGCMIALAADIVIAARSAYFLQAFVNIGLVPDAGSSWWLPRLVGPARASAMMMLGEKIPAEMALEWGMIYGVVDEEELDAKSDTIAMKLAAGPNRAYGLIKQAARAALNMSFSEALGNERRNQEVAGNSPDFREGLAAFREKRKPCFTRQ